MSMLAGPKYITRTLTNVKPTRANYTAVLDPPQGFSATVRPRRFVAAAGAITTVRIRMQKSSAATPYSVWRSGAITWVGSGGTRTRIPLVVRAVQLASRPTEVKLKAWQPSYSYVVEPEWTGGLVTTNTGLFASKVFTGTVRSWEYSHRLTVRLPPGTWSHVRFATFNEDVSGAHSMAMFVDKYTDARGEYAPSNWALKAILADHILSTCASWAPLSLVQQVHHSRLRHPAGYAG